MGKRWVKNELTGLQKTALMHASAHLAVYPIWQPRFGFASNHEFHRYMHARYADRGLENSGLPRPHYEIPEVSDSTGPFNPRLAISRTLKGCRAKQA